MSVLRESVLLQMRLRGFAGKTVDSYIHAMEQLWGFYRRPLEDLSCEEVQRFLDEIIRVRKLSWSTVNVYFSACRFLYEQVLKQPASAFSIPPRGRSGTRPGVLSRQEVERLLEAPRSLKHRALLAMVYGSGLRVSEVVRVRIGDVDRGRMMLKVEQGKGHKDRYTVLSKRALILLEELWRKDRPAEFFFMGQDRIGPICSGTAQAVYDAALLRSGVRRVGGIHVLRHCFASHLMEAGVDIYTIKRWMGHAALATTGRYIHVTAEHEAGVKSPLDILRAVA
ncbi:MAG: tyrosine-type recombinase/integrase [Kiritimatiellia bacterium]